MNQFEPSVTTVTEEYCVLISKVALPSIVSDEFGSSVIVFDERFLIWYLYPAPQDAAAGKLTVIAVEGVRR